MDEASSVSFAYFHHSSHPALLILVLYEYCSVSHLLTHTDIRLFWFCVWLFTLSSSSFLSLCHFLCLSLRWGCVWLWASLYPFKSFVVLHKKQNPLWLKVARYYLQHQIIEFNAIEWNQRVSMHIWCLGCMYCHTLIYSLASQIHTIHTHIDYMDACWSRTIALNWILCATLI